MMCYDDELIVNGEDFYDAAANNYDTTLVVRDSSNLGGTIDGWFEMSGRAHAAGYMGRIPASLQQLFGGAQYYTGWSSVYSITSRYSQGPSLWTFDPYSSFSGKTEGPVGTTDWMNFPYSGGSSSWLSPTAPYYSPQFSCNNPAIPDQCLCTEFDPNDPDVCAQCDANVTAACNTAGPFPPADPVWNAVSKGRYGFFVPNTRTFMVIGHTGGLNSGIGYKALQSNGYVCGGPCPYEPDDYYNYYWLFDANDIVNAANVWDARPYEYGVWDLPFATNPGSHEIIGGTFDESSGILYVAVANAARVGAYDRPPLMLSYALS